MGCRSSSLVVLQKSVHYAYILLSDKKTGLAWIINGMDWFQNYVMEYRVNSQSTLTRPGGQPPPQAGGMMSMGGAHSGLPPHMQNEQLQHFQGAAGINMGAMGGVPKLPNGGGSPRHASIMFIPNVVHESKFLSSKKPGTAQVGAISKAQKDSKTTFSTTGDNKSSQKTKN